MKSMTNKSGWSNDVRHVRYNPVWMSIKWTILLQYELIGIVSGGVATVCGDVDVPGIYIRVNNPDILQFIRFSIEQTVGGNVYTQSDKYFVLLLK